MKFINVVFALFAFQLAYSQMSTTDSSEDMTTTDASEELTTTDFLDTDLFTTTDSFDSSESLESTFDSMESTTTSTTSTTTTTTPSPTTAPPTPSPVNDFDIDDTDEVKCDSPGECEGFTIRVDDAKLFNCGNEDSCRNANAVIINGNSDMKIECTGKDSCRSDDENNEFTVNCEDKSKFEEIKCGDDNSCRGLTFRLTECKPKKILCDGKKSCKDATFILEDSKVREEFKCGGEKSCKGCTVIDDGVISDCEDFADSALVIEEQAANGEMDTVGGTSRSMVSLVACVVVVSALLVVFCCVMGVRRLREKKGKHERVPTADHIEMHVEGLHDLVKESEQADEEANFVE